MSGVDNTQIHNLSHDPFAENVNDPFLTHSEPAQRHPAQTLLPSQPAPPPAPAERQLQSVVGNEFLTAAPPQPPAPTAPTPPAVPEEPRRPFSEVLADILGLEAVTRPPWTRSLYHYVPWAIFLWVMMLWMVLLHFAPTMTSIMTLLAVVVSLLFVCAGMMGKAVGAVSHAGLGSLLVIAVLAGMHAGQQGWTGAMRQYWWMQTGHQFRDTTTAESPAAARVDAAYVDFWNEEAETTWGATSVDISRSAGFRDGSIYCAAPVMNPNTAGAGLPRVEYWAIGVDCCEPLGSFTCDASREWNGGYGVVMLDQGMPCAGCNQDKFRAAVHKAEEAHDLVSSTGALYVRWVSDPNTVGSELLWYAVLYVTLAAFVSWIVAWVLGRIVFHYRFGRSSAELNVVDADEYRQKQMRTMNAAGRYDGY